MFIQQDLKHSETIKYIIKKLQPIVHSLRYANKILLPKTLTDQYFTHVYPYLIGNISIWGTDNQNKTYIQPLIRLHKRIIGSYAKQTTEHTQPPSCADSKSSASQTYTYSEPHQKCIPSYTTKHNTTDQIIYTSTYKPVISIATQPGTQGGKRTISPATAGNSATR